MSDTKDIRSAALPFKRDRDHDNKWKISNRVEATTRGHADAVDRALSAQFLAEEGGRPPKVTPMKMGATSPKSHANKAKPNPSYCQSKISARVVRKVDAVIDVNDHTANSSILTKSLLELLPSHENNTQSAIHTAIRESAAAAAADGDILYSFDNKGPSPGQKGRKVDLGGLVDMAEQKWASEQIERIVKGEYEVLDNEGETTVLTKGRGKKSPKQKATKNVAAAKSMEAEEDDGFELI